MAMAMAPSAASRHARMHAASRQLSPRTHPKHITKKSRTTELRRVALVKIEAA
jgi:hypothetical protein